MNIPRTTTQREVFGLATKDVFCTCLHESGGGKPNTFISLHVFDLTASWLDDAFCFLMAVLVVRLKVTLLASMWCENYLAHHCFVSNVEP